MKQETTNPTYPSYKTTDLVNHLNESGTGTLSQTFNPNFTTQSKPQSEFVYVSTSQPSAIVMISTQYQNLSDKEKLEMLSKLNEWTYNKTSEIINQNK